VRGLAQDEPGVTGWSSNFWTRLSDRLSAVRLLRENIAIHESHIVRQSDQMLATPALLLARALHVAGVGMALTTIRRPRIWRDTVDRLKRDEI
jgi:hypothetical protein